MSIWPGDPSGNCYPKSDGLWINHCTRQLIYFECIWIFDIFEIEYGTLWRRLVVIISSSALKSQDFWWFKQTPRIIEYFNCILVLYSLQYVRKLVTDLFGEMIKFFLWENNYQYRIAYSKIIRLDSSWQINKI